MIVSRTDGLPVFAQQADGDDRDGNRGRHSQTRAQAHVDRYPPEDDAEDRAQDDGAHGELGAILIGTNEGAEYSLRFGCLLSFGHGASGGF